MGEFSEYINEEEIERHAPIELLPYVHLWNNMPKTAETNVPARAALNPADFIKHLPWITLIEIADRGAITFKLYGTGLSHLYGDVTGLTMDELKISTQPKDNFTNIVLTSVEHACPSYHEAFGLNRKARHFKNARFLCLPFTLSETDIDHILVISHSDFPEGIERPRF